LLPKADLIRVVSRRIEESLRTKNWPLKAPVTVEPVSINVEKIKSAPLTADLHTKYPQYIKIILMASRLTWEKHLELALEAMALAVKNVPALGLVIVGGGPAETKLRLRIKTLGLDRNVQFEPWTQQLSSYYKTADIFLNTSYYEGYGRTLLEAQACGLAVISTDVGVAREIGVTITPAEPVALATLLLQNLKS
jgi:1,2-diacylglycerol 3-alpha-glucosyltransferase